MLRVDVRYLAQVQSQWWNISTLENSSIIAMMIDADNSTEADARRQSQRSELCRCRFQSSTLTWRRIPASALMESNNIFRFIDGNCREDKKVVVFVL